jgi:hypothetical protein
MAMKPRATLRQNSYEDLTSAINKLLVGKSEFTHIYQNCLNCKFWNYGKDQCNKFNVKPPATIIIHSCEEYEDNGDIPF